jgi:hypothetical protein
MLHLSSCVPGTTLSTPWTPTCRPCAVCTRSGCTGTTSAGDSLSPTMLTCPPGLWKGEGVKQGRRTYYPGAVLDGSLELAQGDTVQISPTDPKISLYIGTIARLFDGPEGPTVHVQVTATFNPPPTDPVPVAVVLPRDRHLPGQGLRPLAALPGGHVRGPAAAERPEEGRGGAGGAGGCRRCLPSRPKASPASTSSPAAAASLPASTRPESPRASGPSRSSSQPPRPSN